MAKQFISATYHANLKVAEFICDDGRHLLRCGGSLPWRLNNAGDLMSPLDKNGQPAPRKTKNYIGFAAVPSKDRSKLHHFFIFPDYQSGREQLELSLKRRYADSTLPQLVESYAPADSNDTGKYIDDLRKETGIAADKTVSQLSDTELKKLADAIEKLEGYHSNAECRKEIWVPVNRITATDGAKPLADDEIVLRMGGKETTLTSNQYGQFPPIARPKGESVEVLHRQANGNLQSVGVLSGENTQHFSLKTWLQRFIGMPGPDKPPSDAQARKAPLAYTVQPGDTLSSIASRFKTTVEQIKRDNGIRRNMIFAGQKLDIHGQLAPSEAAAKPVTKRAVPKADPAAKGKAAPPTEESATPARSNAGGGKPLALIKAEQRLAPWMAVAFREVTTFAGKKEREFTETRNYHRLVTDGDRAGGRVIPIRGKDGKPVKDKDGNVLTKTKYEGAASLVSTPWCASFVNYCLREAGYAPGRRHMSSYTFGEDKDLFVSVKKPIYGAIRFSHRDGGGHVCVVYGTIDGKLVILGGNQSDQICFQLRDINEKGSVFFVPVPYRDFAASANGKVLPEVDIEALRKEFPHAVLITDTQIKAAKLEKDKED